MLTPPVLARSLAFAGLLLLVACGEQSSSFEPADPNVDRTPRTAIRAMELPAAERRLNRAGLLERRAELEDSIYALFPDLRGNPTVEQVLAGEISPTGIKAPFESMLPLLEHILAINAKLERMRAADVRRGDVDEPPTDGEGGQRND